MCFFFLLLFLMILHCLKHIPHYILMFENNGLSNSLLTWNLFLFFEVITFLSLAKPWKIIGKAWKLYFSLWVFPRPPHCLNSVVFWLFNLPSLSKPLKFFHYLALKSLLNLSTKLSFLHLKIPFLLRIGIVPIL